MTKRLRELAAAPHCDQKVLHAPGKCKFCDDYPEWQELRELWGMNFSNEDDLDKAPDPAAWFRSPELINRWHGNIAQE